MTTKMVLLTLRIESDLKDLLKSVSKGTLITPSELTRESVRFALRSRSFLKRLKLTLDSADPMIIECIGHTSISVRTLMKRLVRRAVVVADNTSSALTIIRLERSDLTGQWCRHFDGREEKMGQEEKTMTNRTETVPSSDARHTPEIRPESTEQSYTRGSRGLVRARGQVLPMPDQWQQPPPKEAKNK